MLKKQIIIHVILFIISVTGLVSLGHSESRSRESQTIRLPQIIPQVSQNIPQKKQKSLDPYFRRFNEYLREGKYEEAISEAKRMIEIAPDDERAYNALQGTYTVTGRFKEALEVSKKVIEIARSKGRPACGSIETHAMILEYAGNQDKAIEFLEKYRQDCPKTVESVVKGLEEARSKGERFFPH